MMAEEDAPVLGRDVVDAVVEFDCRCGPVVIKPYPLFDLAAVKDVSQEQQKKDLNEQMKKHLLQLYHTYFVNFYIFH